MISYVSGSSGFIGKNLTERLDTFVSIPHAELSTIKLETFDCFYFLSAYGNMPGHTDDSMILKANIEDLICILNQVDFGHIKSFVFLSTSSVKLKVQTMYSRTKKAAEEILLSFAEKYEAPVCIIRPLTVTGVGDQPGHLIPTLIRSCLEGEAMNFVPQSTHDFINVEDVVDGILDLSKNRARGIFELGTGISHTNQQVLDIVEKVTGKKANVNIVPSLRPYDNEEWVSTNFKARSWGWMPKITLEQSIKGMVEVYKNEHS